MDRVRTTIRTALDELDLDPAELSLRIGEAPDYIAALLRGERPPVLPPAVRQGLALQLGVPETALLPDLLPAGRER